MPATFTVLSGSSPVMGAPRLSVNANSRLPMITPPNFGMSELVILSEVPLGAMVTAPDMVEFAIAGHFDRSLYVIVISPAFA